MIMITENISYDKMVRNGMVRIISGGVTQLGIPQREGGLKWKSLIDFNDEDFDIIDEYFITESNEMNHEREII